MKTAMSGLTRCLRRILLAMACVAAVPAVADDLQDIRARGELRHLGIRYANFVTGAGDGFDVELVQGFARHLGVRYTLVYSDFYSVIRDLLGQDVVRKGSEVSLAGEYPVRGDIIATGFTVLPWRQEVLLYSAPTFPSQVLLVARAESRYLPIRSQGKLAADIAETKRVLGRNSLLVMEKTCLDPANYGLKNAGIDLRAYTRSANLNEMVPALLNGEAEFTLLDVPDALLDLQRCLARWCGTLGRTMQAQGFNVGLNLGTVAGAGVPGHLHWHVVPRWDGDVNFMPTLAGVRVLPQALDALWEQLVAAGRSP